MLAVLQNELQSEIECTNKNQTKNKPSKTTNAHKNKTKTKKIPSNKKESL